MKSVYLTASLAMVLGACSSSSSSGAGTSSGTPSVKITSPASGTSVVLDFGSGNTDVNGTVSTENFRVGPKGSGADGQVYIIVDGSQCNDHTDLGALKPYNTVVPSDQDGGPTDGNSFAAGIDYCNGAPANITGKHTIIAELHKDDGSPVLGPDGKTVSDSISVTVSLASDEGGAEAGGD